MAQRLPTDWVRSQEPASSVAASIALPAPADARVSYLITHIAAKMYIFAGVAPNPYTITLSVLDNGVTLMSSWTLVVPNNLGAADTLDIDTALLVTPGNGVTIKLSNFIPSVIGEALFVRGTIV